MGVARILFEWREEGKLKLRLLNPMRERVACGFIYLLDVFCFILFYIFTN